jgi:transcriptional regulator with XRE-family HTH domain
MDLEFDEMDAGGAGGLVGAVARNVRTLRQRAGLTLQELADRAGLGRSTLAQLETGRGNPSIETLWALGRALGVPFGALVEPSAPDVRVVRAPEALQVASDTATMIARLMASTHRRGALEVYALHLEPGASREAAPHTAGVTEHVLVTAGRARIGPREQPETLAAGDLISFPGDVPHVYEALEPGTTATLVMHYT